MRLVTSVLRAVAAGAVAALPTAGQSSGDATTPSRFQTRPLDYDQVAAMRFLKDAEPVSLSPDGRWVAYTVEDRRAKGPEGSDGSYRTASGTPTYLVGSTVYVQQLDPAPGGADSGVALTELPVTSWGGTWSPNGGQLAFFSDAGDSVAVWLWDRGSGTRHAISHMALNVDPFTRLRWMPDGHTLLVPLRPATDTAARPTSSPAPAGMPHDRASAHATGLTVRVYRSPSGGTPLGSAPSDEGSDEGLVRPRTTFALLDVTSGRVTPLASGPLTWPVPSPRGDRIAYLVRRPGSHPGGAQYQTYADLVVMSVATRAQTVVARELPILLAESVAWSPDGAWLAYRVDGTEAERGLFVAAADGRSAPVRARAGRQGFDRSRQAPVWDADSHAVYAMVGDSLWRFRVGDSGDSTRDIAGVVVVSLAGRIVTAMITDGPTGPAWSPDRGRSLVILATDTGTYTSAFYQIDRRSGRTRAMLSAARAYGTSYGLAMETTVAVNGGERVVFVSEGVGDPPDLWVTTRAFDRAMRLTHLNPELEQVAMGTRRVVDWTARSGEHRRGLLLLPPGYRDGTRVPLLVWVYERAMPYVNTFGLDGSQFYNLQQFATHGYAVLYPDVEWRREVVMAGLADQVLPGIDRVIALGIADSTRVGVFGHSSGGYDVMALVVQSQRFAAAVESSGWGAADLFSMYATSLEDGLSEDWVEKQMGLGAPPWGAPERYIRNSPGYFLDRVTAPLLILQGAGDDPNGVKQSDELFAALGRLGKCVEYRRYSGEGHAPEWWSAANKADAARRIMEWFELYVARRGADSTEADSLRARGPSGPGCSAKHT